MGCALRGLWKDLYYLVSCYYTLLRMVSKIGIIVFGLRHNVIRVLYLQWIP